MNASSSPPEPSDPRLAGTAYDSAVSEWLTEAAKDLPQERLLVLFEKAVDALWRRARWSIGAVSLIAIVDRAITIGAGHWPLLSLLHVDASGVYFQDLGKHIETASVGEVVFGMQVLLAEILAIIGALTSDMLTPVLQQALARVTLVPADRSQRRQWPAEPEPAEGSGT